MQSSSLGDVAPGGPTVPSLGILAKMLQIRHLKSEMTKMIKIDMNIKCHIKVKSSS